MEHGETTQQVGATKTPVEARVACVQFRPVHKPYFFDAQDLDLKPGDWVVVETTYGLQVGQVRCLKRLPVAPDELKPVLRLATGKDMAEQALSEEFAAHMRELAQTELKALGLAAKVVAVETTLKMEQVWVEIVAELDPKALGQLRQRLSSQTSAHVDVLVVSPRDHARELGGYGVCGQPRCCARFLTEFQTISIRMAKDQSVSMAPSDITGICGRLRCCLAYEHAFYKEEGEKYPRRKALVETPEGLAKVVDWDIMHGEVIVEIPPEGPRRDRARHRFPLGDVQLAQQTAAPLSPEEGGEDESVEENETV